MTEVSLGENEKLSFKQHFLDVYFKTGRYKNAFESEPYCSIKINDGFDGYNEARDKALKIMKELNKDGIDLISVERYTVNLIDEDRIF